MAKRIISDATYTSKKVRSIQPPEFRPEYLWIIPIADDNGVFEYDPERIWAEAYSLCRPGWTVEQIEALLEELIRVGLVIKFEYEDKSFGLFTKAVLPPPSKRFSTLPVPIEYRDGTVTRRLATPDTDTGTGFEPATVTASESGYDNDNGTEQAGGAALVVSDLTGEEKSKSNGHPHGYASNDCPPITKGVVACLEYLSYSRGTCILTQEQYQAEEELLTWAQVSLPEADFVKLVEALRWAQTKSNYWPKHVVSKKNFVTVMDQYDKFYAKLPPGKKPHELALAESEAASSKSFTIDESEL